MSTGTDAASAVSRIALATRSAPLATSSGAGFVPSYFSATAKWVGFVTNDVGGRDVGDHAVSGLRELPPADGASDLRCEVALARLLLDLFLGHLHRLLVAALLPGVVDRAVASSSSIAWASSAEYTLIGVTDCSVTPRRISSSPDRTRCRARFGASVVVATTAILSSLSPERDLAADFRSQ